MIEKLKNKGLFVLLIVLPLSCLAFVLALVAIILYSSNCASEFNGGKVSANVTGLGIAGVILAGVGAIGYLAAFFLAKDRKGAGIFALSRLFNYAAFILLLGGFLYLVLDEYSLIGTIFYPIFSGTVGDPVDPVLVGSYFTAVAMLLVSSLISLAAGIVMRKASHKIEAIPQEANVNE